jgi:hypothetical protein
MGQDTRITTLQYVSQLARRGAGLEKRCAWDLVIASPLIDGGGGEQSILADYNGDRSL